MDVLTAFRRYLPSHPYCSATKAYPLVRSVEHAVGYPYLQCNGPCQRRWIVFDIDQGPGVLAAFDAGLPPPNIIVSTYPSDPDMPLLGTAHLYYGLVNPVCTSFRARPGPLRFAAAIERTYTRALGADPGFAGLMAKNPLSSRWHVRCYRDDFYTLGELARGLDLDPLLVHAPAVGLGRNCTLFDRLRRWAYTHKALFVCPLAWREEVLQQALAINAGFTPPLRYSEVAGTAKSVATWTWSRYCGQGSARSSRGILALDSAHGDRIERQRRGALYTAKVRHDKTLRQLQQASLEVQRAGKSLTQAMVSELTGRSLSTVKRYWSELRLS